MSKIIKLKDKFLGGGNPVLIQSMLNVPLTDTDNAIRQWRLKKPVAKS